MEKLHNASNSVAFALYYALFNLSFDPFHLLMFIL